MGVDGESEENLARFEKEREMGYVDGEPTGMDPRVPEEAGVELDVMRANAPPEPEEFIGKCLLADVSFSIYLYFISLAAFVSKCCPGCFLELKYSTFKGQLV